MARLSSISVMFTANAESVRRGANEAKAHVSSYSKWANSQKKTNPFAGATSGAGQLNAAVGALRGTLAGVGGMFAAAFGVGAIASSIKESLAFIDSQAEMAQQLGVSIKSLSGLSYISDVVGGNTEALSGSISKFQKLIGNAANGQDAATKTLEKYGLKVKDLLGLPLEEQIGIISDKFAELETQEQKVVLATDFFGKSGADMINMLSLGSKEIGNMINKAEGMGLVFDESMAKKASDAEDAMLALSMATKGLGIELANSLAPSITTAATAWAEWISALRESEAITDTLKKIMGATELAASVATFIPSAITAATSSEIDMKDTNAAKWAKAGFANFDSTKAARMAQEEKQINIESQRERQQATLFPIAGPSSDLKTSVPFMLQKPADSSYVDSIFGDILNPKPELGPTVSPEKRKDFDNQWKAAKETDKVWSKINADREKEAKAQEEEAKKQQSAIEKAAKLEADKLKQQEKQTEEMKTQQDMEGGFLISKAGRMAAGGDFTIKPGSPIPSIAASGAGASATQKDGQMVTELQKQTTLLQVIAAKPNVAAFA